MHCHSFTHYNIFFTLCQKLFYITSISESMQVQFRTKCFYICTMIKNQNVILFLISLIFSTSILAQHTTKELKKHKDKIKKSIENNRVIESLDTVFYKGKAVCIYKTLHAGVFEDAEYALIALRTGQELFNINTVSEGKAPNVEYFYHVTSYDLNQTIKFLKGHDPMKELVINNCFTDSGVAIDKVKKVFLTKADNSKTDLQMILNTIVAANQIKKRDTLVTRNRNAMITIIMGTIQQDFKDIGKLQKSSAIEDGNIKTTITITALSGKLIATAKNENSTSKSWTIVTEKDNATHSLETGLIEENEIVKFLVEKLYL